MRLNLIIIFLKKKISSETLFHWAPIVKVISPQRIVDEVVARVKKAISLYNI